MSKILRKTRIVCVSDTHNSSPLNGCYKLPAGDILIHAGDLTNQGTLTELEKTLNWIEKADYEVKIVIAGNHDVTLDPGFYADHALHFHNQYPQEPEDCIRRLKGSRSVTYLNHESKYIRLTNPEGPRTHFKVFGSPYSPERGLWAFGYPPEKAIELWDQIPLDTDIVITHTPPKYHCDESKSQGATGCEVLRQCLWRVRPRLAVCGHIHEGRGVERVRWDLTSLNVKFKESDIWYWKDPGMNNKKDSVIQLGVKGVNPLDNDGSDGAQTSAAVLPTSSLTVPQGGSSPALQSGGELSSRIDIQPPIGTQDSLTRFDGTSFSAPAGIAETTPRHDSTSATRGQGGVLPSGRCDSAALTKRMGRKETCVVNAAIMASSWPHKASGGRRYNKPIVVEIDLPVWDIV
ncbi:MAG: hypothetical protein MMC33_003103 [Icmadophila ericetorum]|nr:hypothetical protein [Icmadophila ericetorum]